MLALEERFFKISEDVVLDIFNSRVKRDGLAFYLLKNILDRRLTDEENKYCINLIKNGISKNSQENFDKQMLKDYESFLAGGIISRNGTLARRIAGNPKEVDEPDHTMLYVTRQNNFAPYFYDDIRQSVGGAMVLNQKRMKRLATDFKRSVSEMPNKRADGYVSYVLKGEEVFLDYTNIFEEQQLRRSAPEEPWEKATIITDFSDL